MWCPVCSTVKLVLVPTCPCSGADRVLAVRRPAHAQVLPAMGRVYSMLFKPTGHDVLWRNGACVLFTAAPRRHVCHGTKQRKTCSPGAPPECKPLGMDGNGWEWMATPGVGANAI